jgi:hypothetical protein
MVFHWIEVAINSKTHSISVSLRKKTCYQLNDKCMYCVTLWHMRKKTSRAQEAMMGTWRVSSCKSALTVRPTAILDSKVCLRVDRSPDRLQGTLPYEHGSQREKWHSAVTHLTVLCIVFSMWQAGVSGQTGKTNSVSTCALLETGIFRSSTERTTFTLSEY